MSALFARFRSLVRGIRRGNALNDDMETEFRLHMELRAEDLVRSGLTPAEAARRARLEFGSADSYKDHGRDARGLRRFDALRFSMLDLKLGGRMLAKHPGLTVIGVIAVAFSICVGAGAFEVLKQVLFPTIPLPNGGEIVALRNWDLPYRGARPGTSRRDYMIWRNDLTTITDVVAVAVQDRNVDVGNGPGEPTAVADVTASTFAMTRVPAFMGRTLTPSDESADAEHVAVIGYELWQNKFDGAKDVIGRVIRVSGTPMRVVGVMPRGYAFPAQNAVWRPLHLERIPETSSRLSYVFGRIASGHTIDEAKAEVATLGARTATAFPETHRDLRAQVVSLTTAVLGFEASESMILGPINIFLVMLLSLVCGNVALLLFARATSRQTEIVVRTALGASRTRIITQLFAEALVLCAVGAVIGLLASQFVFRWFLFIMEGQSHSALPFWISKSLSPATIAYAVALTLLAAIIAGVLPAVKVTSGGVDARLRSMGSGGGGLKFGGLWTGIIVAQIALSAALPLVTSFARADLVKVRDTPTGFAANEFLTATLGIDRIDGPAAGADTTPAARAALFEMRYRALADRLASEPGILGVTYANVFPMLDHNAGLIDIDAGPAAPRDPNWPDGYRVGRAFIDPRFFDVIETPILGGRTLTSTDAEERTRAVLVNESFVKRVLGGGNPIGRRLRFKPSGARQSAGALPGPWYQVVGIVPDLGISTKAEDPKVARVYSPATPKEVGPFLLAVHVRGDPQRFAQRLREITASIDPRLRLSKVQPMPRVLDTEVQFGEFWYHLMATLTGVALGLSLAGVYAVTAFAVAKRTREIGVRVALGARPRQIIFTVFKRPFLQIALGVAVGGIIVTTLVTAGNSKANWATIGHAGVFVVVIGVVCLLACAVPVRRALAIQPTEALKDEG